jgi:threonine aldolase
MRAIEAANVDHAVAYGDDPYTERVKAKMREMFGESADSYVVFSGTGANVLALRVLTRPYHAIICAESAHINENEVGAPEFQTGCKLLTVPSEDGKLTPELVKPKLLRMGWPHCNQPKVISITQPTEVGTLYRVEEIKALADLAHENGMYLHVDGARLGNAVAALGVSPYEMITGAGVDVLSFGGTKNGLLAGEIVVFMDGRLSRDAVLERKQITQLSSKMRFISAQFEAYLREDLWIRTAAHANRMAGLFAEKLQEVEGVRLTQSVEVNGLFAELPREAALKMREHYAFNISAGEPCTGRWMCSFDTTEADINDFVDKLKEVMRGL